MLGVFLLDKDRKHRQEHADIVFVYDAAKPKIPIASALAVRRRIKFSAVT